jgi:hypothetical protein
MIDAFRGLHEIAGFGGWYVLELLRVPVYQWEPRALDLNHDAVP